MRIIACHIDGLHPKTAAAIQDFAPSAEVIDTSADEWEYWRVISSYWTPDDDLMTIERDIEITAECVPSFEACPELWCVYSYAGAGVFGAILDESLGCTRFRKELMARYPHTAIAGVNVSVWPEHSIPCDPSKIPWHRIDYRISTFLKKNGIRAHVHGEVKHYHAYPDADVNLIVSAAVDRYISEPSLVNLESVARALATAKSGELNANSLLLQKRRNNARSPDFFCALGA